ncbi:MAG TPA: hypothetical protein VMV81_10765, partial [Phycisphaerae bacterium]|nr:hypothetical protein [Phycisphaerae bacterium]
AGLIVVGCTLWLGRKLWSAPVAWIAAAIVMTSYGFVFWSRTADADIENLAAVMLALCWYMSKRDRAGFGAFLVFYLIIFPGALLKGLPAIILSVLAVLVDVVLHQRWRKVLIPSHFAAVFIGLALYLIPFIYASMTAPNTYHENGLGMVFHENVTRFFKPFDHTGPVYLYLYTLPLYLLPWAPLFLGAIVALWVCRSSLDSADRWLGWTAAVFFAFFTACGSRRSYYILPLVPFSALLIGVFLTKPSRAPLDTIRRHSRNIQIGFILIGIIAELAGPWIAARAAMHYGVSISSSLSRSMIVLGIIAPLTGIILARFGQRAAPAYRGIWGSVAAATILVGGYFCWQQDKLDSYRSEPAFARTLKSRIADVSSDDIGLYRCSAANLLFYLDLNRPAADLHSNRRLESFLEGDGRRVVITQRQFISEAAKAAPAILGKRSPDLVELPSGSSAAPADEDWVAWIIEPSRIQSAAASNMPDSSR